MSQAATIDANEMKKVKKASDKVTKKKKIIFFLSVFFFLVAKAVDEIILLCGFIFATYLLSYLVEFLANKLPIANGYFSCRSKSIFV